MSAFPLSPPSQRLPIVDGDGVPRPYFMELLSNLVSSKIASDADSIDLVRAPYIRETSVAMSLWTPTVAGSTTAGAQTYGVQWGGYAVIGPMVAALFQVTLTALDGATAGNAVIAGLPFAGNGGAPQQAVLIGAWANVTVSGALGALIAAGASSAALWQSTSGAAGAALPVSALGASSSFTGGALYFP